MKKIHELDDQERDRIRNALADELQREQDVVFAYLYGSVITPLPFEDVDVAVYLRASDVAGKALDLSVRLSDRVRLSVDVRNLGDAPVSFRYEAMKGILLVNRDEDF